MIHRSPCEFYIKFLLLKGYSNTAIRGVLEQVNLDYISDSYVNNLRDSFVVPEPFYPNDFGHHKITQRFLTKERVIDLFYKVPSVRLAFDILDNARAKEFIETMLIFDAPPLPTARALHERYRVLGCTPTAVEKYSHFFWNLRLLDSTELRALLQLRVDTVSDHPDPMVQKQWMALKNASYTDARRTAASLPHSPLSALIAQIQMGLTPKDFNLGQVMDMSEKMTHLRLAEVLLSNGRDFDKRAFNLATTARILQEIREGKVKPEEELRSQLETISLKTSETALPVVHQLTGGNHTISLDAVPDKSSPAVRKS